MIFHILLNASLSFAFFGAEEIQLAQMITNQLTELKTLTELVGVSSQQTQVLLEINSGVEKTIQTLRTLESLVKRAEGVSTKPIQNLSELNSAISEAKMIKEELITILNLKLSLIDQSVAEAAIQSDTSNRMGQEMIKLGNYYSGEVQSASPGRAAQLSAANLTHHTLSLGVMMQTLAQIAQIQAMQLDLMKNAASRDINAQVSQRTILSRQLSQTSKRGVR
ncbi:MAG: hypothetical protein KA715_00135 [Xanthomonadaceae bacterium]|nr:hypothetical protein [Xanthomonadaceae bacterium]